MRVTMFTYFHVSFFVQYVWNKTGERQYYLLHGFASTQMWYCLLQVFENKPDLMMHSQHVHRQDPKPFKCQHCSKSFANTSHLAQHNRIHAGIKPFKCIHCDKRFTQQVHLQQHLRYVPNWFQNKATFHSFHRGDKAFHCSFHHLLKSGFRVCVCIASLSHYRVWGIVLLFLQEKACYGIKYPRHRWSIVKVNRG